MTELVTPSPLMPDPPLEPLSRMVVFSTIAPEITPSPPKLMSPFMCTPHMPLPQITLLRMIGRSALFDAYTPCSVPERETSLCSTTKSSQNEENTPHRPFWSTRFLRT